MRLPVSLRSTGRLKISLIEVFTAACKEWLLTGKLIQLVKEPLLQFLIIGACIYGAYGLFGAPQRDDLADNSIVVDQALLQRFSSQWRARWNRPPTREELDGVINAYVRESILYRQALAMGLDEDDPVTRRRMAQKLEFLTRDIALLKEPAAGELEQFFKDRQEQYREADRITFSVVFFDPDQRGNSTLADAAALLEKLQAAGVPDAATLDAGDRLMVVNHYREASQMDVQRQLGSGFAQSVMQLEPGRWQGPVLSGYGVHLVYVYDFRRAPPAVFEDVREAALETWQSEQQEKFNADFYANLKARYDVVIEEPPAGSVLDIKSAGENAAGKSRADAARSDSAS